MKGVGMHMSGALLSPVVGGVMYGVSAAAVAYSVAVVKKEGLDAKKAAVMGAAGAFVLAAQALNFGIPATGSSGHIVGGVLLAALLGGPAALLVMSAVLAVQCFFFADGGALALGCNVFNLGVVPCLIVYPLLFKPLVKKGMATGRIAVASMAAAVVALQIGALGVVFQTWVSGVAGLPFAEFAQSMQPIHLAIGLVEGAATAAILCLAWKTRPEIMRNALDGVALNRAVPVRGVLALFAIMAIVAGSLSPLASTNPDGLEWSIERVSATVE
jgi:cobalt/nickel transport system permease protein